MAVSRLFMETAPTTPTADLATLETLHDLAQHGHWAAVQGMLTADPALGDGGRHPRSLVTLLHAAAAQGRLNEVRWLVEAKGSNLALRNDLRRTPLDVAVMAGLADGRTVDVVEYLWAWARQAPHSTDLILRLANRAIPTARAAEPSSEMLLLLLQRASTEELNYQDHRFYTPLACACVRGYAGIARLLLLAGAEAYETYLFSGSNAVGWDRGNCNALVKAQAVFESDPPAVRLAKARCVEMIQTAPRVVLLRKGRKVHESLAMVLAADANMEKEDDGAMLLRGKLGGMAFLCERRAGQWPVVEIRTHALEGEDKDDTARLDVCIRHVVGGGLVEDLWQELLGMLMDVGSA